MEDYIIIKRTKGRDGYDNYKYAIIDDIDGVSYTGFIEEATAFYSEWAAMNVVESLDLLGHEVARCRTDEDSDIINISILEKYDCEKEVDEYVD